MSRYVALATLLVSFLIFSSLLSGTIYPVKSATTTITVPDDYPTIQGAIDNANSGDIVFVRSGVYHETIVVNKTVSLIGQDQATTIIDADETNTAILINSDDVTVSGFTVQDIFWYALWVQSSYCLLSNNTIIGSREEGIFLDGRIAHVYGNTVTNNTISDNGDAGILVWAAAYNCITNNVLKANFFGIYLWVDANFNQIEYNNITDNEDAGVVLTGCSNDTLAHNDIIHNGWSSDIFQSGIALTAGATENRMVSNYVATNKIGILQSGSSNGNIIYHNSFINNDVQVYDDPVTSCSNTWDSGYPSGGNYWSDYSNVDQLRGPYQNITGTDGIGDVPYSIDSGNVDHYPLMKPYAPSFGDINDDGLLDMVDIGIVASCFGSSAGELGWNPQADINLDGIIDLWDIALVAQHFGT